MHNRNGKQHCNGLRKLHQMTLLQRRLMKYISFCGLLLGVLIHKFSIHTSHFWRWPCFCQTTGFQAVRSTWYFKALLFISFRSVVSKRNFNIFLVLSFSQDFWLYHHSYITSNCIFIICRHCKIFNTLVPILCGISQMDNVIFNVYASPPSQSLGCSLCHFSGYIGMGRLFMLLPPLNSGSWSS